MARLAPVRRFLAIFLLALLPLQFSWAAVASYCSHETQAGSGHFGHHAHEHQHHADADADLDSSAEASADEALGAMDLDCGHCHGYCSAMFTLPSVLPAGLSTAAPNAQVDEHGAAAAPTRPERPKWLPLA